MSAIRWLWACAVFLAALLAATFHDWEAAEALEARAVDLYDGEGC